MPRNNNHFQSIPYYESPELAQWRLGSPC